MDGGEGEVSLRILLLLVLFVRLAGLLLSVYDPTSATAAIPDAAHLRVRGPRILPVSSFVQRRIYCPGGCFAVVLW